MNLGGIGWVPETLLFLLLPVLFMGGVIVLGVLLIGRSGGSRPARSSTALTILEERYARGEITRDEFLERRRVLGNDRT